MPLVFFPRSKPKGEKVTEIDTLRGLSFCRRGSWWKMVKVREKNRVGGCHFVEKWHVQFWWVLKEYWFCRALWGPFPLKQAPLQNDNLALFSSYPPYKTDLNSTNPTEKHHAPTQETQSRSAVDNLHVLQCFAFLYHSLLSSTPGAKGHVGALELQNDKTGGCPSKHPYKMANLRGVRTTTSATSTPLGSTVWSVLHLISINSFKPFLDHTLLYFISGYF